VTTTHRSRTLAFRAGAALTAGLLLCATPLPSSGVQRTAQAPPQVTDLVTLGDSPVGPADVDIRGHVLPTAAQLTAARGLDATIRWNRFGTPSSIYALDGSLGKATSRNAVTAARAWLSAHRTVLGISASQLRALELVNNQKLAASPARAVLFRQRFGDLTPAIGSMVTVGVARGRIVYVSSSLTRTTGTPAAPQLGTVEGWRKAAENIGRGVGLDALGKAVDSLGWTRFSVRGFAQPQLARVRALGMADGSVRPVIEANVVDVQGGAALAYTSLVDAVNGTVLHRQNQVDHSSDAQGFNGEFTATECGPKHAFELTDGNTRQITVAATALNLANDIVVKLFDAKGQVLSSGDLGTSPDWITYTAPGGGTLPKGSYAAQVCPFDAPTTPILPPYNYVMGVTTSDSGAPSVGAPFPPRWSYFLANPSEDRVTGCWVTRSNGAKVPGCDTPPGALENLAAGGPWDQQQATGTPTFTTDGNAATTHEAWISPLTPGGLFQAPISPTREYTPEFDDVWQSSRCDPTQLVPGGNDIDASVTNLFVAHNRMHDFAYHLGFTEANYNMQKENFGRNADPTRQNDPEVGNVQAGAIGGLQTGLGRDNANQISLQDGVPGLTNLDLFQPLAGSFYSPCTDGSLDMSIVGHEYTHAISNRMIGGPDEGITSEQGGAMGESWGDLTAAEYLFEHGYSNGASPWAVGPYATGNPVVGIRDYAIDKNPLNYGDYGFDSTGPEVHADGEIWNGVQFEVRQALVRKWNDRFPQSDKALQRRCASGTATNTPLPADRCPGNRRWLQLMFDGFLLQQGATSMLDARDAMLAADQMRFGGANQKALWAAFARRGMGVDARTANADDHEPVPGFRAPGTKPAIVRFAPRIGGKTAAGLVYVGRWEARATPVADSLRKTKRDATVALTPGTYDVLFAGNGFGLTRTTLTVKAGQHVTKRIPVHTNLASVHNGAKVVGSSAGSLNAEALVDDTEATNWAGINADQGVDAAHPWVVIDLAGGKHRLHTARVSAMLRPAPASPTDLPLLRRAEDADPDSGSRFTALRRFALEVCVQTTSNKCTGADGRWKRIYTSPADAFPGARPRPVAPNLALRTFDIPDSMATHVRFVALENQCTGFAGYAGEQDNDPTNDTDCKDGSDRDLSVRAAELELF
jgi:hypothetical protein